MSLYALKKRLRGDSLEETNTKHNEVNSDKILMEKRIIDLEENVRTKCREVDELKNKLDQKENSLTKFNLVIFGDSGRCLGLYRYSPEVSCYKQVSMRSDKSRFLYRSISSGCWYVGSSPYNEDAGVWMENASTAISVPLSGWMVPDENDHDWRLDHSIRILIGARLEPEAFSNVVIQFEGDVAEEWPKCGGEFIKNEKFYNGKHVYVNIHGFKLYSDDGDGWSIGEELGMSAIWSRSAGLCPSESLSWSFWYGEEEREALVMIKKI